MAITLSDNIRVNAGKPVDAKYLSTGNTAYTSIAAVNATIQTSERHIGLTVNIMGVEYWYVGGVANANLKIKSVTGGTSGGVTGATNIGYYQGYSGVQVLPIDHQSISAYDGNYISLYNNYYRGTDGRVHIGTPADGIPKRGYVKTTPAPVKSWIWNEYTIDGMLGWIFMDGNISQKIGEFDNGYTYYSGSTFPYTQTSWSGTPPPNGSQVVINTIRGSLTTGTTMTIGGPVFGTKTGDVLNFRTIQTKTPETIGITSDEAFVYISGKTQTGRNLGTGANIYAGNTGTTLQFRSIVGAGNTTVDEVGGEIIIFSSGGTGGGTYDLSSPAAIDVGGIKTGTVLTGKTSFQLFEELLVPEQCGTLSDRSASIVPASSLPNWEIGSTVTFAVNGSFNRGSINPSYWTTGTYSTAPTERVGLPNTYTFSGPTGGGSVSSTGSTVPRSISNHTVAASQSWGLDVAYNSWFQPMSSKNNPFGTQCLASTATASPLSITGYYPYYYGKLTSGSRPPVTNNLVTGGTKVVAPSTNNITISNFNAGTNDYTWVAIPAASPSRQSWYIDVTNKGSVNTLPTDKYPDECLITITTGTGYWSNIPYKVYMSKTIGTINVPIEFRTTPI
jgi:hypothetical protein